MESWELNLYEKLVDYAADTIQGGAGDDDIQETVESYALAEAVATMTVGDLRLLIEASIRRALELERKAGNPNVNGVPCESCGRDMDGTHFRGYGGRTIALCGECTAKVDDPMKF